MSVDIDAVKAMLEGIGDVTWWYDERNDSVRSSPRDSIMYETVCEMGRLTTEDNQRLGLFICATPSLVTAMLDEIVALRKRVAVAERTTVINEHMHWQPIRLIHAVRLDEETVFDEGTKGQIVGYGFDFSDDSPCYLFPVGIQGHIHMISSRDCEIVSDNMIRRKSAWGDALTLDELLKRIDVAAPTTPSDAGTFGGETE